jgi:plastocyanin
MRRSSERRPRTPNIYLFGDKIRRSRKIMRRSVSLAVLAAVVVLGASALTAPPGNLAVLAAQKAESTQVKIDNFSFGPSTLTVPVGATVTWTNRDDIPHTVTSSDDPKVFKSKVLDTDEKFSFTFTKAGTYPYFCSIHPKMTAKVIVE